jgi:hypothetical protein
LIILALSDDSFDGKQKTLPTIISDFIESLELEIKAVPVKVVSQMVQMWTVLLAGLKLDDLGLEGYKVKLQLIGEQLDTIMALLTYLIEELMGAGLDADLSWKRIGRKLRGTVTTTGADCDDPTKLEMENSTRDNLEGVYGDLCAWLRAGLRQVLLLPRANLVPGILTMSQVCVDSVMQESQSNLRKRYI